MELNGLFPIPSLPGYTISVSLYLAGQYPDNQTSFVLKPNVVIFPLAMLKLLSLDLLCYCLGLGLNVKRGLKRLKR